MTPEQCRSFVQSERIEGLWLCLALFVAWWLTHGLYRRWRYWKDWR